jgi:hypothetical protein
VLILDFLPHHKSIKNGNNLNNLITLKVYKPIIIILLISLSYTGFLFINPVSNQGDIMYNITFEDEQSFSEFEIQASGPGETVGIIVDPVIWAVTASQNAINQYKKDLEDTGYTVLLHTTVLTTAINLKSHLMSWYSTNSIVGVVLIGNLPSVLYYHPASANFGAETFICDMFFMDLDGLWADNNPTDGIYDGHSAGTGDIYPEIFVARIDATTRSLGGLTNDQNINNVIASASAYYHGVNTRTHQAITYIDDDWQLWADGTYDNWPGWMDNAYPTRTDVHTPTTATTAADWLTRMTQDYEYAHIAVHSGSSPPQHYFGPGGVGEGTVTSAQIHSTTPAFNFYTLFCCSGADWAATDCLATTYLFSGSHSVAVLGTTKTGGMLGGTSYYNSLAQNNSIGQAFHDWLQNMDQYSTTGEYLEWLYGMTILGDPFATINYDCTVLTPTIISPSHPVQINWYTTNVVSLNWSEPTDVNGIVGYYYVLDQNPGTIPTTLTGIYTTINSTITSPLADGTWYLHVVAKDGAGNVGKTAAHYQVNIDTTDPTISITSPVDGSQIKPGEFLVEWTHNDATSGVDTIEVRLDTALQGTTSSQSYTLEITEFGTYTIQVTVIDNVGLTHSDSITIEIYNFFQTTTFYIILGGGGGGVLLLVIIIAVVVRRRRKG